MIDPGDTGLTIISALEARTRGRTRATFLADADLPRIVRPRGDTGEGAGYDLRPAR